MDTQRDLLREGGMWALGGWFLGYILGCRFWVGFCWVKGKLYLPVG